MMSTTLLLSVLAILSAAFDECALTLSGGVCISGGETILAPVANQTGVHGYWTFDDNSALDYSGHQNHGLSAPPAGPASWSRGASAYFDGKNYLEIPHASSLSSGVFSVTFWAFMLDEADDDGLVQCPLLFKGEDDEETMSYERAPAVFYDRNTHQLTVYISTDETTEFPQGEYVISNARVPFNRWTHVGVVRTTSRIRLYVNGVKDAVNSTEGATTLNDKPLYIGNTPWTLEDCEVPMYIDEVRYYDRDIFAEEVEAEAYGALGSIEGYYIRLGCVNCDLETASTSCPEEYHLCYSIELHSGAYAVARAQGWTEWNGHIWSNGALESEDVDEEETGIAVCCLNL